MTDEVSARIVRKMADVPREAWDALAGERPSPFLRWDWLALLEETGCAVESSGWLPHHVLLHRGKRLVGGCPLYLKLHSMGEFVFDHDWALYAERLGLNYYPKLLVGVPFTPVTGPRFLTAPDEPRAALVEAIGRVIADLAKQNNISSAHVTFCRDDEAAALEGVGYLRRIDVQYHWQNHGYTDFDAFLGEVRGGRRNKIRRERKEIERQGIAIRPLEGDDLTDAALDTLYSLYAGHVDGMYWGRRYLTRALFRELGRRMPDQLLPIVAERGGKIIAGTLNLRDDEALYGRYWGAFEQHRFLHFNVCYYASIEACISRGLSRFEAGAGGDFKQLRGLDPEFTTSMHFIADDRFRADLGAHLARERAAVREFRERLRRDRSQLRNVRRPGG